MPPRFAALEITSLSTTESDIVSRLEEDINSLRVRNDELSASLASATAQLDWFKKQLFGSKSEKRLEVDPAVQERLFQEMNLPLPAVHEPEKEKITYERKKKQRGLDDANENGCGLRFGEDVPVQEIRIADPVLEDGSTDQLELVDERILYRLAQRQASYVVLKYIQPVHKRKDTGMLYTAVAPAAVLEKSIADVSFLAGMLVDKFCFHLPLYRQHQRLQQAGFQLSRTTLSNLVSRAIDLLRPITDALLENIIRSQVLAMDETPIKAGRKGKGKMRQAYIWPVYGEQDEIVFYYTSSRAHQNVEAILGKNFSGTLVSDGYAAYKEYAAKNSTVTHAQCWSHTRRNFIQAQEAEPQAVEEVLTIIGELYRHEAIMRDKGLTGEDKLNYRGRCSEPIVRAFWQWCESQCQRQDLLPSNPLSSALKYAMARRGELQVFLGDPDVPVDTNHLERGLRPIPMGRKNWLFCWTEIGADRVGVIQSLLTTCKLHGVDPYRYLVDVLQRVSQHPAKQVYDLTPRR